MLKVRLEEASIETLRAEAQRLGIETSGKEKDVLSVEIRKGRRKSPKINWAPLATILSLFVAAGATGANFWGAWSAKQQAEEATKQTKESAKQTQTAIKQTQAATKQTEVAIKQLEAVQKNLYGDIHAASLEVARIKKQHWQELVVYSIIDKGFWDEKRQQNKGLSFNDIRAKYLDEAQTVLGIELNKEDIQPSTLHRFLLDLMKTQLIFHTIDDTYVSQRSAINPRYGRSIIETKASFEILHLVNSEGGRYTVESMERLIRNKYDLSASEYALIMIDLRELKYIRADDQGKLWLAKEKEVPAKENDE